MPITSETLVEANRRMLGKTNRAILFSKVNLDPVLDPDVPEEEQEMTPTLAALLPKINDTSDEQFLSEVRDRLTVTSFDEFLDKFQPGFYYRVQPGAPAAEEVLASAENGEDAPASGTPQLDFALVGGPGWKKVRVTAEHPYVRCLTDLIRTRVKKEETTFRVNVDASLFAFKPRNQRALMRKLAEDVQARSEKLMLEAKRDKASKDTQRALESYKSATAEFQGALEDYVRVLPTVVYGLEETGKQLRKLSGPGGGPADPNVYQIEFGKNRALIAAPRHLPGLDEAAKPAIAGNGKEAKKLSGAEAKALDVNNSATALAVRSIDNALDLIREESHKNADKDLAATPSEKRLPIVVGRFMDKMIGEGMIAPLMGNLVATVLQNPKELALVSPDIADVDHYHDVFLGMYSNAVERFLQTVTPLFETIMGVYLLFNEFPRDVRLSEEMKPQLIIANSDLPDLFLTRREELQRFFATANAQAANQFQDAISFVIVPNVAEFRKKRPAKKAKGGVDILGDLVASVEEAQGDTDDLSETYGAATYIDEMLDLMEWGYQYGFQCLFSPVERVRSGRAKRDDLGNLADAYSVSTVVDKDFASCGVLCLPDFVIMPPDGKLVTGRTADGNIEVGVDVPELDVRACYVAAGRLMALDVPDYLRRKLQKSKRDLRSMRPDIGGMGIDLGANPYLGETNLPTDHFINDGMMEDLLSPNMPFLVFTHVTGRSPFLSVPRTMRRVMLPDGSTTFASMHLFRQQIHLRRILDAAHELGYGGSMPADDAEAEALLAGHIRFILEWSHWFNPDQYVNSFPGKLTAGEEYSVKRVFGNTFKVQLGFEQGMIADFGVEF